MRLFQHILLIMAVGALWCSIWFVVFLGWVSVTPLQPAEAARANRDYNLWRAVFGLSVVVIILVIVSLARRTSLAQMTRHVVPG